MQFEVFGRVTVADLYSFVFTVSHINDSMILPGQAGNLLSRQDSQLPFELALRAQCKLLAHANETNAAVGIVLGLAQKVAGNQRGISMIVGHNQDLSRARQQIDSATPEQLSFCFCNEAI